MMLLTNRKVFCLQLPASWSIIRRASSTNHRRTSWFAISPALWNVYWLSFAVSSYTVSLFRSKNEMTKMFTVPTQLQWLREKSPILKAGPRTDQTCSLVQFTKLTQLNRDFTDPTQVNLTRHHTPTFTLITLRKKASKSHDTVERSTQPKIMSETD